MNATERGRLEKNIGKYSWYKVFTKRVYLPLITIQLVNVGSVTVEQLAIIVIISSITQALLEMPSGYVADKLGNRASIIFGAALAVPSPLFYAFMPNFTGGLIASLLFFGGYAFQSGAIDAFMHNTLSALKREKQFAKVTGRAQSYGLIGNVVLLAFVPTTYTIHHTLPFILGFFGLLAMLLLTISFVHPKAEATEVTPKHPIKAAKSIVTTENIALFIFAGFLGGVVNKGGEFRELLFQDIGIAVALFGFILALASLAGAAISWHIHVLDRLKARSFYLFDLCLIGATLVLMGITTNPFIAVAAFIGFFGYGRVRLVIFKAKLLHEIKHAYKATLMSALSLFMLAGEIVAIAMLTKFVSDNDYSTGYALFGGAVLVIGLVLWVMILIESRYRKEPVTT